MERPRKGEGREVFPTHVDDAAFHPEQRQGAVLILEGPDARVRYLNQAALSLLRASQTEVLGRPFVELLERIRLFAEDRATPLAPEDWPVRRILRGEPLDGVPMLLLDRDGLTRRLRFGGEPLLEAPGGRPQAYLCLLEDVTAVRHAEAELRQREADLAEAERLARLGNWTIDLRTQRGHWSDQLSEIYGLPPGAPRDSYDQLWALIHPEDREEVERQFMAGVAERRPFAYDHRIVRTDGTVRSAHTQGRVLTDATGAAVAVFGTTQDITERKILEETLEQQQERLKEAQRIAGLGFWDWDLVNDRLFWSEALLVTLRLDASWQGAPLQKVASLVHPDDRTRFDRTIEEALARGSSYEVEVRVVPPDGQELVLWTRGELKRDAGGRAVRVLGTALDITARKRGEEQVRRSEAMLADAERLARIGSWEYVPETRKLTLSAEFYRIIEAPQGTAMTMQDYFGVVHPEDRALAIATSEAAMQGAAPAPVEYRLRVNDSVKWVRVRWRLFHDESGRIARVVGTLQDVSHERQVEHLKNEFLAIVSHELRTPLTTIAAPLAMLEEQVTDRPESQRLIEIITRSVKRMRRLVDDILDLERLIHGRLKIQLAPTPIARLVTGVLEEMRPLAEKHHVRLDSGRLEGVALCDDVRVSQVLTNVLDNAIAFAPPGTAVTVSAELAGDEVHVRVRDEGPGISPDLQATIFEAFRQGEPSATRRKRGTGLGLALCRAILTQHGGRLWVDSAPGAGSTFHFTLPATQKAGEA